MAVIVSRDLEAALALYRSLDTAALQLLRAQLTWELALTDAARTVPPLADRLALIDAILGERKVV
jgi:hypothetical protein